MSEITKKALVSSLVALCDEKKLNKITINDIVNKCGVNRNTFYYHFADIYDLLDYMFKSEYDDFIKSIKSYSDLGKGITLVIKEVSKYKNLITNVYNSINREQLEKYLYSVNAKLFKGYITETHALENLSQEDMSIVEAYFKCGITGLVLNWIERGMPGEMSHLSNQLIRLTESTIVGIKENMEVKKC